MLTGSTHSPAEVLQHSSSSAHVYSDPKAIYSPTQVDILTYDGDARGNPRGNADDVGKDDHPSAQDAPAQSGARDDARVVAYATVDDVTVAITFVLHRLRTVQDRSTRHRYTTFRPLTAQRLLIPGPRPTAGLPHKLGPASRTVRPKSGSH